MKYRGWRKGDLTPGGQAKLLTSALDGTTLSSHERHEQQVAPRIRPPRPRHTAAAAALVALVAGLTAAPGAAQDLGPHSGRTGAIAQTGAARSPIISRHQLTLITGDRVTETDTSGKQSVSVEPAEGRERVAFIKRQAGRDWTVIPAGHAPAARDGPPRQGAVQRLRPDPGQVRAAVEPAADRRVRRGRGTAGAS